MNETPFDLTEVRHVVFDFNGTLIDDVDLAVETVGWLCVDRGLPPIDRRRYQATFRFPIVDFYAELGFEIATFDEVMNEYLAIFNARVAECRLRSGVRSVLRHFRRSGRDMSILSASFQTTLDETVRRKRLAGYFERVVGLPDEAAAGKLDQARDLQALLRLPAESVLLIGDTTHDVEVARELGWKVLVLDGGHQDASRLAGSAAARLDGFETLRRLLAAEFRPSAEEADKPGDIR